MFKTMNEIGQLTNEMSRSSAFMFIPNGDRMLSEVEIYAEKPLVFPINKIN